MRKTIKSIRQLGANAVEYGLVMALIAGLMIGVAQMMDAPIQDMFECAAAKVKALVGGDKPQCGDEIEIVTEISEGEEIYIAPAVQIDQDQECKDNCQKEYEKNEEESADFFLDETRTCETSFEPPLIASCKLSIILMYEIMQNNNEEQLNECTSTCST